MRLQQSLLNFLINAVNFTVTGSVTLRVIKMEKSADSILLRFEVQDTGIGLSPEAQQRLFARTVRFHESTVGPF